MVMYLKKLAFSLRDWDMRDWTLSGSLQSPGLALLYIPFSVPHHIYNHTNNALSVTFRTDSLSRSVDRFSVMTYDHSRVGEQIAPIEWVKQVMTSLKGVESVSDKLLLGLPMYVC